MPGTGLLFTEALPRRRRLPRSTRTATATCRTTASARPSPTPRNKAMELGPRDRLTRRSGTRSRRAARSTARTARWSTSTCATSARRKLHERLPQIYRAGAKTFLGVDPAKAPIPVLPGGALHDGRHPRRRPTASPLPGLYAAGECSSVGIHGANRLGSNSLAELLVFGKVRRRRGRGPCAKAAPRRRHDARAQARRGRRAHARSPASRAGRRRRRAHRDAARRDGADAWRTARHLPHGSDDAGDVRQARRAAASATATVRLDDR